MEMGGQRHAPAALPRQRDPLTIIQETGWAPGSEWTGTENLPRTEIRSLEPPARSESLYGLCSRGSYLIQGLVKLAGVSTRKFKFPVERSFLEVGRGAGSCFGLACTQVRPPRSSVVAVLAAMSPSKRTQKLPSLRAVQTNQHND